MKSYDFQKAQKIIEENAQYLDSASLGMHEDWSWTAETVFEEGNFILDLSITTKIGGIAGSSWATPTLQLVFKDGTDKMIPCSIGESSEDGPPVPLSMFYGPISGPTQANITPLSGE